MSGISPSVKFGVMNKGNERGLTKNPNLKLEVESTNPRSTPRRLSFNKATTRLKLSIGTPKPTLTTKAKSMSPQNTTLKTSHEKGSFPISFKLFSNLFSSSSSSSVTSSASSTNSLPNSLPSSSSTSSFQSSTSVTSKRIHVSLGSSSASISTSMATTPSSTPILSSSSSSTSSLTTSSCSSLSSSTSMLPLSGSFWPPTHFATSRSLEPKLHLKLPTPNPMASKTEPSTSSPSSSSSTPFNMLVTIPLKRLASSTLATLPRETLPETLSTKKPKPLPISPPDLPLSSTPSILATSQSKKVSVRESKLKTNGVHLSSHPPPTTRRNTESKIPKVNHDYCEACRLHGSLLCCESCPRSFHLLCLNPPLDYGEAPDGAWYCQSCSMKKKNSSAPLPISIKSSDPLPKKVRDAFQSLVHQLEHSNPTSFRLPNYIIHSFDSLTSNIDGEFELTTYHRSVKRRNGKIEPRDLYRISLPDGTPVLCYACASSSLNSRPLLGCDFCNLYFHLDCLDPPLVTAPSVHEKWKCPCHADWTLPHLKASKKEPTYYRHGTSVTLPQDLNHVNEVECIRGFLNKLHSELHPS